MDIGYLDLLDALLLDGVSRLGEAFVARQVAFVRSAQRADGGFPGRLGPSDPYYTDFALRILMLGADATAAPRVAAYMDALPHDDGDIVAAFSRLHATRLLRVLGQNVRASQVHEAVWQRQGMTAGGFVRPGGKEISAYQTFLAALCAEMCDRTLPQREAAVARIAALQRADGGFSDLPSETQGQTNSTAAAIAFMLMNGPLPPSVSHAAEFLLAMQAPDGGLRAHAGAPGGDLLSTFTGLLTLAGLDALPRLDLPALARFLRHLALPHGGFRAALADEDADIEYTYYGLATLAILKAALLTQT
ncbi:MAG TPA: prenyltransferase/squalene oxidase repeat-containing protein [Armatimonadota bacterium]|jgi:geranylgeranyl transferase type-2 subunit beta